MNQLTNHYVKELENDLTTFYLCRIFDFTDVRSAAIFSRTDPRSSFYRRDGGMVCTIVEKTLQI